MGRTPANLALFIEKGIATRFKRGQVSPNKGVPMSDEQKVKLSATLKLHPRASPNIEPVPPVPLGLMLSHASLNVRKWRAGALAKLGNKCCRCGFNDVRALQIDHINGGGGREIHITFKDSPRIFYKAVIADTDNKYQLLCANCNQIKRTEEREV